MVVRVADGSYLTCDSELPNVEWEVQGHSFHSTLWVIPLGSYDISLGMDWLEAFSPMKVNWKDKWMLLPYGHGLILLQGLLKLDSECSSLQLFHIASDAIADSNAAPLPP